MFPKLELVMLIDCIDEPDFIPFLELLPNLKELTISDMKKWTSFKAGIGKRVKNGHKPLQKIQLPRVSLRTTTCMRHEVRQPIPKQDIELALYEPGQLLTFTPPEFQEEFCNTKVRSKTSMTINSNSFVLSLSLD